MQREKHFDNKPGPWLSIIIIFAAVSGSLAVCSGAAAEIMIYPDRWQSRGQQAADERECHNIAVQESGYDPAIDDTIKSHGGDHQRIIRNPVIRSAARGMATGGPTGAAVGAALARRKQQRKALANSGNNISDPMYEPRRHYAVSVFDCLSKKGYTIEDTD